MSEKNIYNEMELDPTLREFWLDGLAQQARWDAYTAETSGNHRKARELLKKAEKYEAEAEIIRETLPEDEQQRNFEKMEEFMRRADMCRERQKATVQKLKNLEQLVEQDENGAEISAEEQEILAMLKWDQNAHQAILNLRNSNLDGLVKDTIMYFRKMVENLKNLKQLVEQDENDAEISAEEQEILAMLKLDQNAHQAILNLRNSDFEGLDEEVKDTIMYFRKIEMEDEVFGKEPVDDSDNDANVKNSTTSEPEIEDDTDSDLESEILETDEMDEVTNSPLMTSSVPKFALIFIVPIFLAILLYLAPIDFSDLFNGLYEN